jgi:hypothetical protein
MRSHLNSVFFVIISAICAINGNMESCVSYYYPELKLSEFLRNGECTDAVASGKAGCAHSASEASSRTVRGTGRI